MFPSNTSFYSAKLKVLSLWFCFMVVKFCPQFSFSCRSGCQRKVPILLSRKQNIFPKIVSAFSFFIRNGPNGHPQLQKECEKEILLLFSCRMGRRQERKAEESFGEAQHQGPLIPPLSGVPFFPPLLLHAFNFQSLLCL